MDYGIKVYPLYLGTMHSDSNYVVSGDTMATRANPHAPHCFMACPSTAYVIEHPQVGYILFDTGMPDDPESAWPQSMLETMLIDKPKEAKMINQLGLLGLNPEDISVVINSHWHMDHTGNDDLFAKTADFYVSRLEAEAVFASAMSKANMVCRGYYIKEEVLLSRKSITYIDEDTPDLFPGIDAYIVPGHTAGTMILHVHLKDRDLILCEDAVSCKRNFEGILPGAPYDSLGYGHSIRRIRKLAFDSDALVLFGHDEAQFSTMKLAPDYYE